MATSRAPLRAVEPDERVPSKGRAPRSTKRAPVKSARASAQKVQSKSDAVAKSVTEAAKSGDRRALLVAMRDRVAATVENTNTPARDLAALTKRLLEISNDIEAIDSREGDEKVGGVDVEDGKFDAAAI